MVPSRRRPMAHRPPRADRQQRDEEVFRVHLAPDAEGAADVGLQEVHGVLGQPRVLGDDAAVDVRDLRHAPHAEHAAAGIPLGQGAARLQRHPRVTLDVEGFAQDEIGLAQRPIDVAALDPVRGDRVRTLRLEEPRGPGLGAPTRVHQYRERLVVHPDGGERVLGAIAVVGHDGGDRFAHVADLVVGERGLQKAAHLAPLGQAHGDGARQRGHVGEGDDVDHARAGPGGGHVDRGDARVGVRAAHHREVQRVGTAHVGDEGAAAPQQALVLAPLQALAHVAHARWPEAGVTGVKPPQQWVQGGTSRAYTGCLRNSSGLYFQNWLTLGYVKMTVFCSLPFTLSTLRM